ncbi:MAG: helix-turn-helix domain-containing protein [Parachlamydiaceae bacterium]
MKRLRVKKKLTQEKIAYFSGISHNIIVKIENDATKTPAVKTLSHIAKASAVSADRLITGKLNEL